MPEYEIFPPAEARALIALTRQVIPSNPDSPDGADGGGVAHLLRELAPGGALHHEQERVGVFLTLLNGAADGDFAGLPATEQEALLRRWESEPSTKRIFAQLVEWISEGFYASPAGWNLVGFRPFSEENH